MNRRPPHDSFISFTGDPGSFNLNVAHVATIQANLLGLASRLDFGVGQAVDHLEEHDVAYLQLSEGFYS